MLVVIEFEDELREGQAHEGSLYIDANMVLRRSSKEEIVTGYAPARMDAGGIIQYKIVTNIGEVTGNE